MGKVISISAIRMRAKIKELLDNIKLLDKKDKS
jgi:hypothetical protein